MRNRVSRRGFVAALAGLGSLSLAGCGRSDPTPRPDDTSGRSGRASAFPVEIEHGQGRIRLDRPPRRVIVLGSGDAQLASALNAPIVAAAANPSRADGRWPAMPRPLGPRVEQLNATEPELERIAALRPDLMLATTSQPGYTEAYAELSTIAPVLSYRDAPLQDSGDDLARMIGRALGRAPESAALITRSRRRVDAYRERRSDLDRVRYAFGQYVGDVTQLVVGADSLATHFMTGLGARMPADIARLRDSADGNGMVSLGPESLDVLDSADVALISAHGDATRERFERQPLIARMRAASRPTFRMIPVDLAAVLLTPNPATTAYLIDRLDPLLAPGH